MNTTDRQHTGNPPEAALPEPLVSGLQSLRVDVPPGRDLWPGIAARLEPRGTTAAATAHPQGKAPAGGSRSTAGGTGIPARHSPRGPRRGRFNRRNAGYAAAAAVVLAAGIGWQLWPASMLPPLPPPGDDLVVDAGAATDAPLLLAADALSREYQGALREVQAATGVDTTTALEAELERSAAEVRAALARDPDALHLFHHLQRIYAHRLALNLRQA